MDVLELMVRGMLTPSLPFCFNFSWELTSSSPGCEDVKVWFHLHHVEFVGCVQSQVYNGGATALCMCAEDWTS